jgi:hypothetical protein
MNLYYWTGYRRVKSRYRKGKVFAWGYIEAPSKAKARSLVRDEVGYAPDEVQLVMTAGGKVV